MHTNLKSPLFNGESVTQQYTRILVNFFIEMIKPLKILMLAITPNSISTVNNKFLPFAFRKRIFIKILPSPLIGM
jgi:hypothetical protein